MLSVFPLVFLPLPTGGAAYCLVFDLVLGAAAGLSFATGATETRGLLADLVDGALTTGSSIVILVLLVDLTTAGSTFLEAGTVSIVCGAWGACCLMVERVTLVDWGWTTVVVAMALVVAAGA